MLLCLTRCLLHSGAEGRICRARCVQHGIRQAEQLPAPPGSILFSSIAAISLSRSIVQDANDESANWQLIVGTVLALAVLNRTYAAKKSEWSILAEKARNSIIKRLMAAVSPLTGAFLTCSTRVF